MDTQNNSYNGGSNMEVLVFGVWIPTMISFGQTIVVNNPPQYSNEQSPPQSFRLFEVTIHVENPSVGYGSQFSHFAYPNVVYNPKYEIGYLNRHQMGFPTNAYGNLPAYNPDFEGALDYIPDMFQDQEEEEDPEIYDRLEIMQDLLELMNYCLTEEQLIELEQETMIMEMEELVEMVEILTRGLALEEINEALSFGLSPEMTEDPGVCSICLDSLQYGQNVATLICSHRFHPGCIADWLSTTNQCPNCGAAPLSLAYW